MDELLVDVLAISVILELSSCVVIVLFQVSREASSDIVGGTGKRVEVHHFAVSSFVFVVHTPVYDNLSSADHFDDDLLGGGTEVRSPAVNEGHFYES